MKAKIRFYKGIHKVKVVTESIGYYIVEALESFEDYLEGKRIKIRKGDQRIVTPDTLYKKMTFQPPIQEHAYELKMEKKVKELLAKQKRKKQDDE